MFFCRGVLETVKKLGWKPDVIHCHGWMTSLMPMYVKDIYKNDPHFTDTKVIYSLYDNEFNKNWDTRFDEKLKFEGFDEGIINSIKSGDYLSLNKAAMEYADGIVMGSDSVNGELKKAFDETEKFKLEFESEEPQPKVMSEFFDKVIDEEALIQ
jgi:starch synthase